MKRNLFTAIFSLLCFAVIAQRPVCGLPGGEADKILIDRLKANKRAVAQEGFQRSGSTRYVPVVVHDIRKVDNTGAMPPSRIFDQICSVNDYYEEQGTNIQLYLEDINIINNDLAYSEHYDGGESTLFQERESNVINIFIPQTANTGGNSIGTVLGYYDPGPDWIVMRPAEVSSGSATLFHELGHYFSLPHPFRGWDFEPYDPATHGVQVGVNSPNNNVKNEFQNGSNCNTAGDLICDTPPDYNHFSVNWGCNYTGGAKDPNGDLIDPDEENIMSYFDCNNTHFSDDQIDLMNADLNFRLSTFGSRRLTLSDPSPGDVGEFEAAIEPIDGESAFVTDEMFFDWEDVSLATQYVFEIDRFPNFGFGPKRVIVEESQLFYDGTDLLLNLDYYWRVRAVSPWDACSSWSAPQKFKTALFTDVNEVEGLTAFSLFPNPVSRGGDLTFQSKSTVAFEGNLQIINISGQVVQSQLDLTIGNGISTSVISTNELVAGVYFLRITSSEGVVQEKFIVQ